MDLHNDAFSGSPSRNGKEFLVACKKFPSSTILALGFRFASFYAKPSDSLQFWMSKVALNLLLIISSSLSISVVLVSILPAGIKENSVR